MSSSASRPTARPSRARAGFTLIEIMVVIAIIGLLLTVVAPSVWNKMRQANVVGTQAKMTQLKQYLADYRNHHNKLPSTLEELLQNDDMNLGEPWVENDEALKDAWHNEFQYVRIDNNHFDLISLGADGQEGGDTDDADIHSKADAMPGK